MGEKSSVSSDLQNNASRPSKLIVPRTYDTRIAISNDVLEKVFRPDFSHMTNVLWLPIRKRYRLVSNIDTIMLPNAQPGESPDETQLQLVFWPNMAYALDSEHTYDNKFYQHRWLRSKYANDRKINIVDVKDDPKMVHMGYITKADYEREINRLKDPSHNRVRKHYYLEMEKPTVEQIEQGMREEVSEFLAALLGYIGENVPVTDPDFPTVLAECELYKYPNF